MRFLTDRYTLAITEEENTRGRLDSESELYFSANRARVGEMDVARILDFARVSFISNAI